MTKAMRAYHGSQKDKDNIIAKLKFNKKRDEFIHGTYGEDGIEAVDIHWKGACGVGCTVGGNYHKDYERRYGIPAALARIEDQLFEKIPMKEQFASWPIRLMQAINPGADLRNTAVDLCITLMRRPRTLANVKAAGVLKEFNELHKILKSSLKVPAHVNNHMWLLDCGEKVYAINEVFKTKRAAAVEKVDGHRTRAFQTLKHLTHLSSNLHSTIAQQLGETRFSDGAVQLVNDLMILDAPGKIIAEGTLLQEQYIEKTANNTANILIAQLKATKGKKMTPASQQASIASTDDLQNPKFKVTNFLERRAA